MVTVLLIPAEQPTKNRFNKMAVYLFGAQTFLLLLLTIGFLQSLPVEETAGQTSTDTTKVPTCHCALFVEGSDTNKTEPLFKKEQKLEEIKHDDEGKQKCAEFCVGLADIGKNGVLNVPCNITEESSHFYKVRVYSKLCGEGEWRDSKKVNTLSVCCRNGLSVECKEQLFNAIQKPNSSRLSIKPRH